MKDSNGWEIVSTYSTKQVVEDGFLAKVDSKASKKAGIKFPVYITRAAWDKYVEVPKGMEQVQNLLYLVQRNFIIPIHHGFC